jgi:hypothetical protein
MTTFTDADTKADALLALNENFNEISGDLAGKANLTGGNTFEDTQVVEALDVTTADVTTFKIGGVAVTPTAAELNYVDGVTSAIQTQLDAKGAILLTVPTSDGTAKGPQTSAFNSGFSSSAVGDLVYLDSSATWQKVDANSVYSGLLGIALAIAASGAPLLVALPGSFVYATAFPTFTVGGLVYASETAGAVTQAAPTTTDAATRVIGHAVHADKMFFNPSNDYTTHT